MKKKNSSMSNEKKKIFSLTTSSQHCSNESLLVNIFVTVVSLTSQNENVIFTG